MERNVELLHSVAEKLELEPYDHNQSSFCGSTMCVAGWAALLSGRYEINTVYEDDGDFYNEFVPVREDIPEIMRGNELKVSANLLGLTFKEMHTLYFHFNSPAHELTWPEALYKIAAGEDVDYILNGW